MISIVTVNWNSYDFLDLLIESIEFYTNVDWDLIVIDNSIQKKRIMRYHVHQIITEENIGHGAGLNLGADKAVRLFPFNRYVLFLDVDTHFLCHNWESEFLSLIKECDVIVAPGVPAKPIRPACLFTDTKTALSYNWEASPGYKGHRVTPEGTDVAVAAYHQMTKDGVRLKLMDVHPNHYGTHTGEEWGLNGRALVYHHWHGSHLDERQIDFPNVNLQEEKSKLFSKIIWRNPF